MKKILSLSILLMLLLTACGASQASATNSTSQNNSGNSSLAPIAEYLVGILKLQGTPQAVTADQAAQLIPLWQTYQSLSASDSAAQQEMEALVTQIHDTLTPDQQKAITDMKLTRQDEFTLMQQMGVSFGGRGGSNGTQTAGGDIGGGRNGGGGFPGGGGGGGGGFTGGGDQGSQGGQPSPQQLATFQAQRAQGGGGSFANRIPTPLMDALIQYLQTTAGVPTSTPHPRPTPPALGTETPQAAATGTPQVISTAMP